ncbi:tyrosine-type recombinase/integrase [Variovorax sp. J31P207]|nr:tyrosine-type recombinase/integrase [Variovorax sp. J31P207]
MGRACPGSIEKSRTERTAECEYSSARYIGAGHADAVTPQGSPCLLAKHVAKAAMTCPSLKRKRVSPHVLRHTTAMDLLQEGVDRSVIALWLGHESIETTQMYLDADLDLKKRVLDRTTPPTGRPGRYRPDDKLLAFLKGL